MKTPNKTLHTNCRPGLGFGLGIGLFNTDRRPHVIVRAAVGELGSSKKFPMASIYINYPHPHVAVHHDSQCGFTKREGTSKRRKTIETALDGIRLIRAIEAKKIKFSAVAGLNGLWVLTSDEEASGLARETGVWTFFGFSWDNALTAISRREVR